MSRFDNYDIALELIELCRELQSGIIQDLNYYRASVYKSETGLGIDRKLEQLKMVVALFDCDETLDYFLDFEASRGNGNVALAPGECLLTWRISNLFKGLEISYSNIGSSKEPKLASNFQNKVLQKRKRLASLCPAGSRKRSCFETR